MIEPKHVTAASRVVAALVFAPFVVATLDTAIPSVVDALGLGGLAAPLPGPTGAHYVVSLGWLLGTVLVVRVFVTDDTVDGVLAVFSIPSLVGGPWAVYRTHFTASPEGAVLVPVWTAAAGLLLAGFVLLDGVMNLRRSGPGRRSKTNT